MPELPEVEITCRGIRPYVVKNKINKILVRHPQLRWPIPAKMLQKNLLHQTVLEVQRRAKYIVIRTANGYLVIHLGMSGTLRLFPADAPLLKHDHFICELSTGASLRLNDPRRFGAVLWSPDLELPQLKNLGIEPLAEKDSHRLFTLAQKHRCAIKTFIMNQRIIVGVGNIYASESLHIAKIHPMKPAKELSSQEMKRLFKAVQAVLKKAIQSGGTTLKDFYNPDGKKGYFSQKLKVYDRANDPCYTCDTPIAGFRLGQRSTFYCPTCQPQSV